MYGLCVQVTPVSQKPPTGKLLHFDAPTPPLSCADHVYHVCALSSHF